MGFNGAFSVRRINLPIVVAQRNSTHGWRGEHQQAPKLLGGIADFLFKYFSYGT